MAFGGAAETLTSDGVRDEVPTDVLLFVISVFRLLLRRLKMIWDGTGVMLRAARSVGIMALVGEQVAHATGAFERTGRGLGVADVVGRQHRRAWVPYDIGERMNLDRPAVTGVAGRTRRPRPFAPDAARWAFT